MKILKYIGIGVVVLLIIGFFIKDEITVVNENGYLGMDKDGRQILIQTLNQAYSEQQILVDSEFNDTNFIYKLLFGEPMRTTLRMIVKDKEMAKNFNEETIKLALAQSSSVFLDMFKGGGKISLTESDTIDGDKLIKRVKRYEVNTFEDLLTAFGFKKYEVYANNELVASITLNNKGNTVRHGGLLKATTMGYAPPKMKADSEYVDITGKLIPDYE